MSTESNNKNTNKRHREEEVNDEQDINSQKRQKLTPEESSSSNEFHAKYTLLQEEYNKLVGELSNLKETLRKQENEIQSSFGKVQAYNNKLIDHNKELIQTIERLEQAATSREAEENKKILQLRQVIAKHEQEKIDVELERHASARKDIALQRYQLEIETLKGTIANQADQRRLLKSLTGITTKPATTEGELVYDLVCKSQTHVLRFQLEPTEEGHIKYLPKSYKRIDSQSSMSYWDELTDSLFHDSFVINGDLLPVFATRLLATLNPRTDNFTI